MKVEEGGERGKKRHPSGLTLSQSQILLLGYCDSECACLFWRLFQILFIKYTLFITFHSWYNWFCLVPFKKHRKALLHFLTCIFFLTFFLPFFIKIFDFCSLFLIFFLSSCFLQFLTFLFVLSFICDLLHFCFSFFFHAWMIKFCCY